MKFVQVPSGHIYSLENIMGVESDNNKIILHYTNNLTSIMCISNENKSSLLSKIARILEHDDESKQWSP